MSADGVTAQHIEAAAALIAAAVAVVALLGLRFGGKELLATAESQRLQTHPYLRVDLMFSLEDHPLEPPNTHDAVNDVILRVPEFRAGFVGSERRNGPNGVIPEDISQIESLDDLFDSIHKYLRIDNAGRLRLYLAVRNLQTAALGVASDVNVRIYVSGAAIDLGTAIDDDGFPYFELTLPYLEPGRAILFHLQDFNYASTFTEDNPDAMYLEMCVGAVHYDAMSAKSLRLADAHGYMTLVLDQTIGGWRRIHDRQTL